MFNYSNYLNNLNNSIKHLNENDLERLKNLIVDKITNNQTIFLIGNGGSAGNAIHIANDFLCGLSIYADTNCKVNALPANQATNTCLANDIGYDLIFEKQLEVLGRPGDLLLSFTGSGNSKNIINAIKYANRSQIDSFLLVGYDGGECLKLSSNYIHININDMQICEDLQLIIFHMIYRSLLAHFKKDS